VQSPGPGNVAFAWVRHEQLDELFTAFGGPGSAVRRWAQRAADQMRRYLETGAVAGPYLADQLLVPLALAEAAASGPWPRPRTPRQTSK
jgi:RNA 3'-terminal phosphate cyclase (ATP)